MRVHLIFNIVPYRMYDEISQKSKVYSNDNKKIGKQFWLRLVTWEPIR